MLGRSEDAALLAGRLMIGAMLLPAGIQKLTGFSKFAASVAAKGLPYPKVWAALDVAVEVLGPIALAVGLWPRWTALVLLAVTAAAAWSTYRHGALGTALRGGPGEPQLFKNLAVAAGLLLYFASGPGAWSRTGLRRG